LSIPLLVAGVREIVEEFGTVLDIIAKKSLKRKGQAFVVFSSVEEAQEAHDILQDIELFDRKIQVQYARARSDVTVQKDDGDEALEEHKKARLAEKGEALSTRLVRLRL
jgi:RNA recognition motif-containing protein